MGFYAYIEFRNSPKVVVKTEDEKFVKDSLLNFLFLSSYYNQDICSDEVKTWFKEVESRSTINMGILDQFFYVGNFDYAEDEYDLFLADWGDQRELSVEMFIKTLRDLEKKWTPIHLYKQTISELVKILPSMEIGIADWFCLDLVITGLKGILHTLDQVEVGDDLEIRLQFL